MCLYMQVKNQGYTSYFSLLCPLLHWLHFQAVEALGSYKGASSLLLVVPTQKKMSL